MLQPFSFATATEIAFGRGEAAKVPTRISALGRRVLLVHGRDPARSDWLRAALGGARLSVTCFAVPHEPDTSLVEAGLAVARAAEVEVVVAIGGGAVVDGAKALAALVPAPRPMMDHLEVVGRGVPLEVPPLPFIAIPTTAGTGAEATRNAVIGVPEHRRKVSLRDRRMLPRLAVVDPSLTDNCPRGITLASGLDAITQVIEPFVCTRANPLTDALCRDAIPRGFAAIRRLMAGEDPSARDEMAWVSLCGGLALANAGLGAVHGLAGPLGGLTGAAHGAICGALLPHVLIANQQAVTDATLSARLSEVAGWIGAALELNPTVGLGAAATALADWAQRYGLPGLTALGVDSEVRRAAALAAASSSSMKANPAPLDQATLETIMKAAA